MPKIRSITYFADLVPDTAPDTFTQAGRFLQAATTAFEKVGQTVQTRRFASQPFPAGVMPHGPASAAEVAREYSALANGQGIEYLSLGPVGVNDDPAYIPAIADMFRAAPGVFASVAIADRTKGISLRVVDQTAGLIDELSRVTPDGMTNLYLAGIANCGPGAPFFPSAYHGGGPPRFALAIQAADLAVGAFHNAASPDQARKNLTAAIQQTADALVPIAWSLADTHDVDFGGLDFSLAPYPVPEESLGGALEALGARFGGQGLVVSASLVMSAIEAADFPRTGFSGLMLPILEDSVLASRTAEGRLTLNDLLLLSAVCGTGLDCIPLPGNVGTAAIRDILLDVAALALRLNKPLTARLMPFPGKKAGDSLQFDFEYFADSRVLPAPPPAALSFGADASFTIRSRVLGDES